VVRSSTPLAGGVGETREMCGAILGGIQAIGLRYGRADLSVSRQAAVEHAAALVTRFRDRFGTVTCRELVQGFREISSAERRHRCAQIVALVSEWVEEALRDGARP